MKTPLPLVTLLAAIALALGGCATNPVSGGSDFVLLSEQQELAMGAREHPNILKQFGEYDQDELGAYVSGVGERVARRSHRGELNFHFTVLDSDQVNAFALPGGYVYITRGLMAYLNSEAELAAVLGHEIGHVTARHGVRQYSAATATGFGVALGAVFVPELRGPGAQDLVNVLGTAFLRGYGREHELEADRLGAEYLARAGYSPEAMLDVITVLKNQELFEKQLAQEQGREPRTYHGVFATHPRNDERLQTVVRAARGMEAQQSRAPGREVYLEHIEGLVFGPGAGQGTVQAGRFYHQGLDIGFDLPKGWAVHNGAERLVAVAPGKAALLQVSVQPRSGTETPESFLRHLLEGHRVERGRELKAGTLEGYTGIALLDGPFGSTPTRVTALFKSEQAFLFIGANDPAYPGATYDEQFLASARSLHRLSKAERKLAAPLKLAIVRADAKTTYAGLAQKSRLRDHVAAQLRLINGQYPEGEPSPGQRLKIIE